MRLCFSGDCVCVMKNLQPWLKQEVEAKNQEPLLHLSEHEVAGWLKPRTRTSVNLCKYCFITVNPTKAMKKSPNKVAADFFIGYRPAYWSGIWFINPVQSLPFLKDLDDLLHQFAPVDKVRHWAEWAKVRKQLVPLSMWGSGSHQRFLLQRPWRRHWILISIDPALWPSYKEAKRREQ